VATASVVILRLTVELICPPLLTFLPPIRLSYMYIYVYPLEGCGLGVKRFLISLLNDTEN